MSGGGGPVGGAAGGPRRRAAHRLVIRRRPPGWAPVAALGLVAGVAVGVLGFVTPGFFVTRVFDAGALRDGVRTVLERDFGLDRVAGVQCPAEQRVGAGERFVCTVRIDGAPAVVPVEVQDGSGRYTVGRPS